MHWQCRRVRLSLTSAFYIFIALYAAGSAASNLYDANTSVRALGMGNAYLGVVRDADSLFYNPAGLARVSGINWLIADVKVGANGAEVMETINDIQGSSSFSDTINSLYGDHVWLGAGAKSAFTLPYLGVSVYDSLDAMLDVNNPMYPNLDISAVNDYGYAIGGAIPLLPTMHIGTVIKYIQRTGSRVPFGPSFVGSLDPDTIMESVETKGRGYSMDLGLNLLIPGPVSPVMSFVWRNVGVTSFKAESLTLAAPPRDLDEMSLGLALNLDAGLVTVNPAFDFRYLNRSDVQLGKKVHFGVEIGLPLIDIRAGFNQGYYTAGVGLNLGIIRMDAATYGEELGAYPGQREDRRYMLQFSLELGFDPISGTLGGGSGGSSSSSASKSSSGGGGRRGPRLKQRR